MQYVERLSESGTPVEVELPLTRDDEFDLLTTVNRLAKTDQAAWQSTVRMYTAVDYYFLSLFLSGTQRLDPFRGAPEVDCDFLFNYFREVQFNNDRWLDKSARGHWKSTIRTYVGVINALLVDPNTVIAIAAHEKAAAQRHGVRTMLELETNTELKAAWPDVLWADPRKEATVWNQETGFTVKRTLPAVLPSVSWFSILSAPTGSRISIFCLDDIEDESTVESPDMREKTIKRVASFLETAGRVPRIWINGTHFHSQGVIAHLEKAETFNVRCHPIEDLTKEPPDIAALYDECGGVIPLRDGSGRTLNLPPAIRDIRLDGAPVYLHPLEVAQKRLDAMSMPGGLDNYYRQNFGDAMVGQQRKLDVDWIRWYDEATTDRAEGGFGYILIDPSKGANDPMYMRLEVTHADKTISWVDALRKKVSPSEFGATVLAFASKWSDVVQIRQIRVEEFGQSTWSFMIRSHFDQQNKWVAPIIACSRHTGDNKEKNGRIREWLGLEPMYRQGKRYYPKVGITVFDERGVTKNAVAEYIKDEYSQFPMPHGDDGLAADYLLTVTKGKNERGQMIDLELEYPDTAEGLWLRRRASRSPRGEESTWMSGAYMETDDSSLAEDWASDWGAFN